MKERVVVSRKWQNPQIHARMCSSEISMDMSLDDFVQAVAQEVGSPTFVMTKAELLKRLQAGAAAVVQELKSASRFV